MTKWPLLYGNRNIDLNNRNMSFIPKGAALTVLLLKPLLLTAKPKWKDNVQGTCTGSFDEKIMTCDHRQLVWSCDQAMPFCALRDLLSQQIRALPPNILSHLIQAMRHPWQLPWGGSVNNAQCESQTSFSQVNTRAIHFHALDNAVLEKQPYSRLVFSHLERSAY